MSAHDTPSHQILNGTTPAPCTVLVTLFSNHAATTQRTTSITLTALADLIRRTAAASKGALPWLKLARFGDVRTSKGSLRHDINVLTITGLEGDFDAATISFQDACDTLASAGVLAILYTSPSHTEDAPRWRVLCPFSTELPPTERNRMMDRLNGVFGGVFAAESWTLSQSYYFGSVKHNPSHQVTVLEGQFIDLIPELDAEAIGKPTPPPSAVRPTATGNPDAYALVSNARYQAFVSKVLATLSREAVDGQKHHALLRTATTLGGIQAAAGFTDQQGFQWLMDSLPDTVADWNRAARTAADGLARGRLKPIALTDRDNPRNGYAHPEPETPAEAVPDAPAPALTDAEPEADGEGLPEITVIPGLRHEAADAGLDAMQTAKVAFYQRDKIMVRVCSTAAKSSDGKVIAVPGIVPVTQPMLGRALNTSAIWRKSRKRAPATRADCPREVVEEIASMVGYWPFPPLAGVIGTQTMRPDGSILSEPGYDTATGLYLHEPPPMPPIPDKPTWQDAETALSLLNSLLSEFPFVSGADRSVGMSMLMTPVLRAALGSAVPMHVATAPTAGTGKSYLCDVASALCIGERCPVMSVAKEDSETEKRLIGSAIAGNPIIALDNCNGVLSGDFLAQVTERPVLEVRGLGSSNLFRINNTFTVFATGNNIVVKGDLTRRTVRTRLDANTEDPTRRTFSGNPVSAVLADRGRYVAAVLTIARAYMGAGKPNPQKRIPSYEPWSDIVCGALVWLKWDNPADTMALVKDEDPSGSDLGAVLETWPDKDPQTADQLIDMATSGNHPLWLETVRTIGRDRHGNLDAATLGRWLARNRDQMTGNRKLLRVGTPTRPKWKVGPPSD